MGIFHGLAQKRDFFTAMERTKHGEPPTPASGKVFEKWGSSHCSLIGRTVGSSYSGAGKPELMRVIAEKLCSHLLYSFV